MERIWFDQERENFFAVPDEITIPKGETILKGFGGRIHRVDAAAIEPWRISKEQASARINARVEKAWGNLRGAVDRLFLFGETAARQAGVEVSEDERRSPLPEKLSAILGMEPGEMLTEPDRVRDRLRAVAEGFGVRIKDLTDPPAEDAEPEDAPAEDTEPPPGFRDVDEVDAEEVLEPEPEPDAASTSTSREEARDPIVDPLRDLLNRPEVNDAITGFGRALSQLGRRLQEASRQEANRATPSAEGASGEE